MFGIPYVKAGPTTHVIQYVNGHVVREGPGLSFFYYAPHSTIVKVPLASVDVPFIFNEVTADFQDVTLQGQLTYRVVDPKKLSLLLDFSVGVTGRYTSEDPKKLDDRLVNFTQVIASAITHRMKLRDMLGAHDAVVNEVMQSLKASPSVAMLGVEVMSLALTSIKPSPETAKALEAEAREAILRTADAAVYARRNAAVAQERLIKESELNTEMAVEEKRRQMREAQMKAEIALEEQRAALVDERVANDRKDADAKAYDLTAMLAPLKNVDPRTLMALNAGSMDARQSIAMAFRELAENATKIKTLNISPDLLGELLDKPPPKK